MHFDPVPDAGVLVMNCVLVLYKGYFLFTLSMVPSECPNLIFIPRVKTYVVHYSVQQIVFKFYNL